MSMRGLGGLANLAKILEEANNPESELREDRQKPKKRLTGKKIELRKTVDPKRKAWHERRLREMQKKSMPQTSDSVKPVEVPAVDTKITKSVAAGLTGSLMATLAAAKDAKPKVEASKQRAESWRRKPGDPVF